MFRHKSSSDATASGTPMPVADLTRASTERVIAMARLTLAAFSLLAVWLDPTQPARYERLVYSLLAAYAVYALVLALRVGRSGASPRHPVLQHILDLAVVSLLMSISAGANSPLFQFYLFALLAGTLRWQRRGALWTLCPTLAIFIGMGAVAHALNHAEFELDDFVMRAAALAVVAVLLGELTSVQDQGRRTLQKLALPPDCPMRTLDEVVGALLQWGADVMGAPRALAVWEEPEEPWLHLAGYGGGPAWHAVEPPQALGSLVAADLARVDFLCQRVTTPDAQVLCVSGAGLARWRGVPLDPAVLARFPIDAVLSLAFASETAQGRLFFIDKTAMTADDLRVGGIVCRHVAGWLNEFYLRRRLAATAALEERLRVARDLHDGGFHVLTGFALELERLLRMPELAPARMQERLRAVQRSLADEQRTLRMLIDSLRSAGPERPELDAGLDARLGALAARLARQWGLEVHWRVAGLDGLSPSMQSTVYLMVHEALVNVARHAGASAASVDVTGAGAWITITVQDNGHGLAANEQNDRRAAPTVNPGPRTLRERATSLGGSVAIDSSDSGTRVAIELPVEASMT
jgi:signal transduction histidine kinase